MCVLQLVCVCECGVVNTATQRVHRCVRVAQAGQLQHLLVLRRAVVRVTSSWGGRGMKRRI